MLVLLSKAARELQGKINFHGLDISIESRMGSIRQWYDPHEDKSGMTRMERPYGYIKGTLGTDGDHYDVYVGPDRESREVYIVTQMKAPEFVKFDEEKALLGFKTKAEAKAFYLRHYDNPKFMSKITAVPFEEFAKMVMKTRANGGKSLIKARMKRIASLYENGSILNTKARDMFGDIFKPYEDLITLAGGDPSKIKLGEFISGMKVELEHTDVTGGDQLQTAKIVLAHLAERDDYYTKLEEYVEKSIPTFLMKGKR